MPIPVILVDGLTPPPLGSKANGTKAAGASVTLSLASTAGIDSIEWRVSKPTGSAAALGSAFPAAPFSTTFGPLAEHESYLITAIANGDPKQVAYAAISVPSATRGLRTPRAGETTEWDPSDGIEPDWRALVQALDSTLTLTITDNVTLTEDQSAATLVVLTGSPAASYVIEWVDAGSGTVVVVNNTGHAHRLAGADVATHVAAAGGVVVLFRNGIDIRAIGGTRDVQTIVGSGGTTAIEGGNRTVVVDVSAAGHTVQLPDPVAINDRITVKAKGDAAAHNLVISHGGSKIDGAASGTTINTFGGAITFESDLNNWWIVARA